MKTRLQSLGLVDRSLRAASDDEIDALVGALGDDHREALERLAGGETTAAAIREAATKGRIDGTMESIVMVLTDASLADCIEQLGDHADNPTTDQLQAVLPGVVERHGVAATRLMLAATVAGEAQAAPVIRDLLKRDETVKVPPAEPARAAGPITRAPTVSTDEREAIRAKRQEQKRKKQDDARLRREQSARARHRA